MIPPQDRMRPGEASAVLGVHPRTVTRWAQAGKLAVGTSGSGQRWYSREQVLILAARTKGGVHASTLMAACRLAELAKADRITLAHAQALVAGWWAGEIRP